MGKFKTEQEQGATPLNPDELEGLIPNYISTQEELNNLERKNILEAEKWLSKKKTISLNISFLLTAHKKMFENVWTWAGKTRTSDKSIGIFWQKVTEELSKLLDDTQHWIDESVYSWDELAIRFHHRLVSIHPFPNGNGRHARLMTDLLLASNNQEAFSWGEKSINATIDVQGVIRDEYIASLKEADDTKNFSRLLKFAKS